MHAYLKLHDPCSQLLVLRTQLCNLLGTPPWTTPVVDAAAAAAHTTATSFAECEVLEAAQEQLQSVLGEPRIERTSDRGTHFAHVTLFIERDLGLLLELRRLTVEAAHR